MGKKLLTKFKIASLITLSFLVLGSFFFAGKIFAAATDKPVPGGRIPCPAGAEDLNFNSLRPYQASPCGDTVKARYCSNDLDFIEDFKVNHEGDCQERHRNDAPGQYEFTCDPNHYVAPHNLYVDLADSTFPIEGNTDLVKNATSNTDSLDNATKMNEYVSWYLNGVDNRAENGTTTNTADQTINYSGPIQKLMPQTILEAQRISTVNSITANVAQDAQDEDIGAATPAAQPGNHDQIVVCANPARHLVPVWFSNILGITGVNGVETPVDCYPNGNGTKAQGDLVLKLSSWSGSSQVQNLVNTITQYFPLFVQNNFLTEIAAQVATRWPKNSPPLPWSDQNGKPFATTMEYQKAYNEWRGELCAIVTIPFTNIKTLVCLSLSPIITNPYADLFPFIPLANTVDKKGVEFIEDVQFQPSGETQITGQTYDPNTKKAPLYFAHTEETMDLSNFLNSSYTPKGVTNSPVPATTETNVCSSVKVETNSGDNLFPGYPHGIEVDGVTYTITQAKCTETVDEKPCPGSDYLHKEAGAKTCRTDILNCNAEVIIVIKTGTKTPFANEIFSSTVADSGSTFRKIYPKVEAGAPVSCVADIPTVTNVTYTAKDTLSSNAGNDFKVVNYPADGGATKDAPQLTFPHIGSVYDYFLKGIQTALRPKGYADPTPQSGTQCASTAAGGDCSWNIGKINAGIAAAAAKYNVPAPLLHAIFSIEMADEINDPSKYQCSKPDQYGSIGVSQVREDMYKTITCPNEQIQDVGVCGTNPGKLSRCNFGDAFELMARTLLYKAGRLSNCKPTGGINLSEKTVWYKAACDYYGTSSPTYATNAYANEFSKESVRPDGMSYCDDVCYLMGQCSGSNYPAR